VGSRRTQLPAALAANPALRPRSIRTNRDVFLLIKRDKYTDLGQFADLGWKDRLGLKADFGAVGEFLLTTLLRITQDTTQV
jgi:hypothetical protein